MNVTENYLLQQMQSLAAAMSNVPQTGTGKDKEGASFQEMLDQAGKPNASQSAAKDTKEAKDPKDPKEVLEEEAAEAGKLPNEGEEQEELKPEQLTANPNAVSLLDLFRPEVVETAEEPVIEVPVDAVAEEGVEAPDLALDGQMTQLETSVEADVDTGVAMEQQEQPQSFREAVSEAPQEKPVETTVEQPAAEQPETVEAPEAAPERVEDPVRKDDAPEIEVHTEEAAEDEPKAEAVETEQPVFHETESAPVKVGETYETVDTEQPDMEQKLSAAIREAAQAGTQKIEIRLTPQNLGSLTIEMTKDANGALQVVLHASNAKAAGVLNQHMDGLQMALRGYSQEEVRIEVQRGEESQQQNFRQADPDGRGQHQQRQQQERHEEKHSGEAFMQKLRLGLFGTDEI